MNQALPKEHIHVNTFGEFDKGCICGSGDFYAAVEENGNWKEIEPIAQWQGWACIGCNRVFSDEGKLLAHPETVAFLQ